MIEEVRGNLLDAEVDALVNTVNTVGVMGKGVALQFKQAFPENYDFYKRACSRGELSLGHVLVYDSGKLGKQRYIVNFPTKGHWRSRSRLDDIRQGLKDLALAIEHFHITSIAVPALGCGNGGLDWSSVRTLIHNELSGLSDVRVLVYPPQGPPEARAMRVATKRPNMTLGRAALLSLMGKYVDSRRFEEPDTVMGASLLEIQKLMYLLQESGEELRLKYVQHNYGPYAENLNHVLQTIEGHFLRGFGDRTQAVLDLEPLVILPGALDAAAGHLAESPETRERCEFVVEATTGFQTPYGLELLATVHWVSKTHGFSSSTDVSQVVDAVHSWSRRKQHLFTERHIQRAWNRLIDVRLVHS